MEHTETQSTKNPAKIQKKAIKKGIAKVKIPTDSTQKRIIKLGLWTLTSKPIPMTLNKRNNLPGTLLIKNSPQSTATANSKIYRSESCHLWWSLLSLLPNNQLNSCHLRVPFKRVRCTKLGPLRTKTKKVCTKISTSQSSKETMLGYCRIQLQRKEKSKKIRV